MHSKSLYLTTAVVASVLMLSACNKPGAAPATPAVNAAAPGAIGAVPVLPAPAVATPAQASDNTAAGGRRGRGMGGARGGKGGKGAMRAACADDIQKFCAGGGKVGRCLKLHASALSQACAQAREARKEARQAGR